MSRGRWDMVLVKLAAWAWLGVACLALWGPVSVADGPGGRAERWGVLGYRQVTGGAVAGAPASVYQNSPAAAATACLTVLLAVGGVFGVAELERALRARKDDHGPVAEPA